MHAFSKALALAAALVAVAPAHAGDLHREKVAYADLDLSTDAGRAALNRRVHAAAGRVCAVGSRELGRMMLEQRCVAEASEATAAQIAAIAERNRGVALASVGATQTAAR